MPEFYSEANSTYQPLAQPYLDAIAHAIKDDPIARAFLLEGTQHFDVYKDAEPLWSEQWKKRDPKNGNTQPFWANYWYEPCHDCNCRIDKSVSMEIDAIFFLRQTTGRILAIHVEMKRDSESLSTGQAEAYGPRAACFQQERRKRATLNKHDDWVTLLLCGTKTNIESVERHFDRVIVHDVAKVEIAGYPAE